MSFVEWRIPKTSLQRVSAQYQLYTLFYISEWVIAKLNYIVDERKSRKIKFLRKKGTNNFQRKIEKKMVCSTLHKDHEYIVRSNLLLFFHWKKISFTFPLNKTSHSNNSQKKQLGNLGHSKWPYKFIWASAAESRLFLLLHFCWLPVKYGLFLLRPLHICIAHTIYYTCEFTSIRLDILKCTYIYI